MVNWDETAFRKKMTQRERDYWARWDDQFAKLPTLPTIEAEVAPFTVRFSRVANMITIELDKDKMFERGKIEEDLATINEAVTQFVKMACCVE